MGSDNPVYGVGSGSAVPLRWGNSCGAMTMPPPGRVLGNASGVGIGGKVLSTGPKPKGASLNAVSLSASGGASPAEGPPSHSAQEARKTRKANKIASARKQRELRRIRKPPLARLGRLKLFEGSRLVGQRLIPSLRPATAGTPTGAWFPGLTFACRVLQLHRALFHHRPGLSRRKCQENLLDASGRAMPGRRC